MPIFHQEDHQICQIFDLRDNDDKTTVFLPCVNVIKLSFIYTTNYKITHIFVFVASRSSVWSSSYWSQIIAKSGGRDVHWEDSPILARSKTYFAFFLHYKDKESSSYWNGIISKL